MIGMSFPFSIPVWSFNGSGAGWNHTSPCRDLNRVRAMALWKSPGIPRWVVLTRATLLEGGDECSHSLKEAPFVLWETGANFNVGKEYGPLMVLNYRACVHGHALKDRAWRNKLHHLIVDLCGETGLLGERPNADALLRGRFCVGATWSRSGRLWSLDPWSASVNRTSCWWWGTTAAPIAKHWSRTSVVSHIREPVNRVTCFIKQANVLLSY